MNNYRGYGNEYIDWIEKRLTSETARADKAEAELKEYKETLEQAYKLKDYWKIEVEKYKAERDELIKAVTDAIETIYDSATGSGCVARDMLEIVINRIKGE